MPISSMVRNVATVLVIAVACPLALLVGVDVSCAAGGMTAQCANNGLLVAPLILIAAGIISAFLNRGFLGFVLGLLGIIVGMALIWVFAAVRGIELPLDPAEAFIATLFFGVPPIIGWSIAKVAIWTYGKLASA